MVSGAFSLCSHRPTSPPSFLSLLIQPFAQTLTPKSRPSLLPAPSSHRQPVSKSSCYRLLNLSPCTFRSPCLLALLRPTFPPLRSFLGKCKSPGLVSSLDCSGTLRSPGAPSQKDLYEYMHEAKYIGLQRKPVTLNPLSIAPMKKMAVSAAFMLLPSFVLHSLS